MEIVYIIVLIITLINVLLELKRDLMMLQQNSYRNERYMRWLRSSQDSTSMPRIIALALLLFSLTNFCPSIVALSVVGIFSVVNSIKLFRAKYKKPLVFTNRARRIYSVAIVLSMIIIGGLTYAYGKIDDISSILLSATLSSMGVYVASHIMLYIANIVLAPVEKHINKKYYNDAARILASMPNLKIIGITGSYGKTSTKHYLHRILSEKYDVLMTPGSFNTTLGVIRTVREHLKPYNEVFIVEMGAKQQGDITEICDLVKPHIGIVTAVGEQHLESFKSIENVQSTKFELIDALPSDGVGVVNDDFPYIANRHVDNVECVRYAVNETANALFTAKNITYDETGTHFTVEGNGKELSLHTRLVGECNISNLIAAVIIAMRLEVPDEKIRYAVEKIEQVEHRLNLKRTPGGITIIDDAFNSNPTGSKMAMDVLSRFNKGKRIVITPGMIELGSKQYELNEALGVKIAQCADVAIIVGEYNKDALLSGINQGEMNKENVHAVVSFNEAQRILASIAKAGDTVLYENDLPDTFK